MQTITKLKLGAGGLFLAIVGILWAFGGILGVIIGIARDDALSAVLSLLIPAYGALYTVYAALDGLF